MAHAPTAAVTATKKLVKALRSKAPRQRITSGLSLIVRRGKTLFLIVALLQDFPSMHDLF